MKCSNCKNEIKLKKERIPFIATKPFCAYCYRIKKPTRYKGNLKKYYQEFVKK